MCCTNELTVVGCTSWDNTIQFELAVFEGLIAFENISFET